MSGGDSPARHAGRLLPRFGPMRTLLAIVMLIGPCASIADPATASVSGKAAELAGTMARGWADEQDSHGQFPNPSAAELAEGKGGFSPPMLMHGLLGSSQRGGEQSLADAAARAWPSAVAPSRASAFDMLGAGMSYRRVDMQPALREMVAEYLRSYAVTTNGRSCIVDPGCYTNLKLVDALAVLVMTGSDLRSDVPGTRLHDPQGARAAAARVVNEQVPSVVDGRLRARLGRKTNIRGSVLSDPGKVPLAYHALSAYMLAEAVHELGPEASSGARRALDQALDALTVLTAPDGDVSYLGRGQAQVWVPAMTAAAAAHGARMHATDDRSRMRRHLAVADRALDRLQRAYLRPDGRFSVVPGMRTSTLGIDWYAHTVAYNGLALFAIDRAAELLAPLAGERPGALPADRRLTVTDPWATHLGVSQRAGTWLAVRGGRIRANDLRYDFGVLALKSRQPSGWQNVLAPRPLTKHPDLYSGPALMVGDRPARPEGRGIRVVADGTVQARLLQRADDGGIIRRLRFFAKPVRGGARLALHGVRRGDSYRLLIFTPAGTGSWNATAVRTDRAAIRFSSPIRVARRHGFHSAPVESLDALEVTVTAAGRAPLRWRLGVAAAVG